MYVLKYKKEFRKVPEKWKKNLKLSTIQAKLLEKNETDLSYY